MENQYLKMKDLYEVEQKKTQSSNAESKHLKEQTETLQKKFNDLRNYSEIKNELIDKLRNQNKTLENELKKANSR